MNSPEQSQPFLYSVERSYPYPVERIWHAWTDSEDLEAWYHPTDLVNVPGSVVSDVKVGGWWTVAVDASSYGFISYFWGQYTHIEPYKTLEHSMYYTQDEMEFQNRDISGESDTIVVTFTAQDQNTHVRFSQYGALAKDQIELAQAGMESYFQSLHDFLSMG